MRSLNRWFVWLSAPTRRRRARATTPSITTDDDRMAARSWCSFARFESALNMRYESALKMQEDGNAAPRPETDGAA